MFSIPLSFEQRNFLVFRRELIMLELNRMPQLVACQKTTFPTAKVSRWTPCASLHFIDPLRNQLGVRRCVDLSAHLPGRALALMEYKLIGWYFIDREPSSCFVLCVNNIPSKRRAQKYTPAPNDLMNIQNSSNCCSDGFEIVESNKLPFYDNNKELLLLNILLFPLMSLTSQLEVAHMKQLFREKLIVDFQKFC